MHSECMTIRPDDALRGVVRERHTRRAGMYMVRDKYGKVIIAAQKLSPIVAHINSMAQDEGSRVSVTALYEIVGSSQNRVSGYSKNRWKLDLLSLEEAGEVFERERKGYESALVLGCPRCYQVESKL